MAGKTVMNVKKFSMPDSVFRLVKQENIGQGYISIPQEFLSNYFANIL